MTKLGNKNVKKNICFWLFLFLAVADLKANQRESSAPYISGDSFRASCDFVCDELSKSVNPDKVKEGDTIFVKTDLLNYFFKRIHPRIKSPYVLVTHNSDASIPSHFAHYLKEDKIIAWFGQNLENSTHPKIHPIPIGIANRCWAHGNVEIVSKMQQVGFGMKKNILLYMNFHAQNYIQERGRVFAMFKEAPYCTLSPAKEYSAYLLDLAQAKFVLSPRGNGLDCHRTWEALLMGAIPIVKTSSLDPLFANLPVLIVKDWSEINKDFLEKKYIEMQQMNFQMEKIYFDYWRNLIETYKVARYL